LVWEVNLLILILQKKHQIHLTTLYEFDQFNLVWDSAMGIDNGSYERDHGIAFIGNNANLILNRGGWEVIEESRSKNKVAKP